MLVGATEDKKNNSPQVTPDIADILAILQEVENNHSKSTVQPQSLVSQPSAPKAVQALDDSFSDILAILQEVDKNQLPLNNPTRKLENAPVSSTSPMPVTQPVTRRLPFATMRGHFKVFNEMSPREKLTIATLAVASFYYMPTLSYNAVLCYFAKNLPEDLNHLIFPNSSTRRLINDSLAQIILFPAQTGGNAFNKATTSFLQGVYEGQPIPLSIRCLFLLVPLASICGVGPGGIFANYINQLVKEYGSIVYLIGPALALAEHKGPPLIPLCGKVTGKTFSACGQGLQAARDVFDLMQGCASDEVNAEYEEDSITKAIDTVFSKVGNTLVWLCSRKNKTLTSHDEAVNNTKLLMKA